MKRLSFIIALALVLTIGGVYATFSYAGNENAVTAVTGEMSKTLAGVDTKTSEKGTLAVIVPEAFSIEVDDTTKTLTTGGKYPDVETDRKMIITFTPDPGSSVETLKKGINLKLTFTNAEYNKQKIFTFKDADVNNKNVVHLPRENAKFQNGKFVFELDLAEYITVTAIELPTLADYTEYAAIFNDTNFKLNVTIEEDK